MSEEYDLDYSDSQTDILSELQEIHSALDQIHSELASRPASTWDFWSVFGAVFVFYLLTSWEGSALDRWTDKAWYSNKYDAKFSDITIQRRPVDCDILHAPIGLKGCDYKKKVEAFDDEKRRELMGQALTEEDRLEIAKRPNSVTVYWEKEED